MILLKRFFEKSYAEAERRRPARKESEREEMKTLDLDFEEVEAEDKTVCGKRAVIFWLPSGIQGTDQPEKPLAAIDKIPVTRRREIFFMPFHLSFRGKDIRE